MANFPVGTILVYICHYTARIPNFARVVKTTPSGIYVERLEKRWVQDDGYRQNGSVMPNLSVPGTMITNYGKPKLHRVKILGNGTLSTRINDSYTYVWDGSAEDQWTD